MSTLSAQVSRAPMEAWFVKRLFKFSGITSGTIITGVLLIGVQLLIQKRRLGPKFTFQTDSIRVKSLPKAKISNYL